MREVEIGGRRFAVHRGWNRLPVRLRARRARSRVRLSSVRGPRRASEGAGGIRELRIPGVRVDRGAAAADGDRVDALRGADLRAAALDLPLRARRPPTSRTAAGATSASAGRASCATRRTPSAGCARVFAPPAARRYAVDGWATRRPAHARRDVLDALAGTRGAAHGRLLGALRGPRRATAARARSTATRGRAWIGQWIAGRPAWLAWRRARARSPSGGSPRPARRPRAAPDARAARRVDGARRAPLAVGADGAVALPRAGPGTRVPPRRPRRALPGRDAGARPASAARSGSARCAARACRRCAVPRRRRRSTLPCGAARRRRWTGAASRSAAACRATRSTPDGRCASAPARPARSRCPPGARRSTARRRAARSTASACARPRPRRSRRPRASGRVVDPGRAGARAATACRVSADRPVVARPRPELRRAAGGRAATAATSARPRPMQGYANGWPVDRGCRARALRLRAAACRDDRLRRLRRSAAWRCSCSCSPGAARLAAAPAAAPAARRARPPRRLASRAGARARRRRRGRRPRASASACAPGSSLGPLLGLVLWRGVPDRVLVLAAGALLGDRRAARLRARRAARGPRQLPAATTRATRPTGSPATGSALAALTALGLVLWRTLASARAAPPAGRRGGPAPSRGH